MKGAAAVIGKLLYFQSSSAPVGDRVGQEGGEGQSWPRSGAGSSLRRMRFPSHDGLTLAVRSL